RRPVAGRRGDGLVAAGPEGVHAAEQRAHVAGAAEAAHAAAGHLRHLRHVPEAGDAAEHRRLHADHLHHLLHHLEALKQLVDLLLGAAGALRDAATATLLLLDELGLLALL